METVMTDEEIEQEAKVWIRHNHELLDYSDFHDDVEFDHAQVADLAELYRVGYRACEQKWPVIKDKADKAYCEKANAEIKLDKAKEIIKKFLYNVEPYSIDNDVLDEAKTFMKNIEL